MNKIIESARAAQKLWAKTPLWNRAELLHRAAAILKEHKTPIAECLVKEIAKPAKDAVTEVCLDFVNFMKTNCEMKVEITALACKFGKLVIFVRCFSCV